ncbi:MAG: hypothetical protein EAY81_11145 [Bacteroidetes bacterium]|nr:MAG: hypothetical protein EAY81_11145 [Bacteroidota bacterium]
MKNKINYFNIAKNIGVLYMLMSGILPLSAKENIGLPKDPNPPQGGILGKMTNCAPATQQKDLDVNNVRTTILNGGDMWWNLSNARYEIPKVQAGQVAKNSLFSGALWIGGVSSGNLKLAAQTYRQSGNDFYPGPLTLSNASVSPETCKKYDRIYKVTLREITAITKSDDISSLNISKDILEWPGNGDLSIGTDARLAPFYDADSNGVYSVESGDYPTLNNGREELSNIPDMMLFMIYNDKGNIHSETQGIPIGLEFHTQAFAYSTNNEINNMTFYRTTIFNRSSETVDSTVFGQWVDADLGNYADDYVECDVDRNLGICYNGDDNDEGILGYGLNPPSVGITFFEGPKNPVTDKEIGLTKFVYYNNDFSVTGNPSRPEHFWGYLNGRWKDGGNITYGGNGRNGSDTASFMFPGDSDPAGRPTWNERIAGNQPQDRRFLQTAGPFSLLPGAVNRVTVGAVWARASSGGATGSFNLLKLASDKATTLYKNNFELKVGPAAPQLTIIELNKKLVITFNKTNEVERYKQDFAGPCAQKTTYKFQGYQVWQLKTPSIPSDISDVEQARLVAQFDIVDGVSRVVNTIFDPTLEENVKRIMVEGANKGLQHSFEITKDLFETGSDQTLVNFKSYHYYVVAYATADNCANDFEQYLSSSKTFDRSELSVYTAVPHDPTPKGYGLQSDYGTGIPLTMLEGMGNGGREIRLTEQSINQLLQAPYYAKERTYEGGFSPAIVKVVDPLKVPKASFELGLRDTSVNPNKRDTLSPRATRWYLKNLTTGEVRFADTVLANSNEQLFADWGISVQLSQSIIPGDQASLIDQSNGYISSSIDFYGQPEWLTGVVDEQITSGLLAVPFNWIRAGSTGRPDYNNAELHDFAFDKIPLDPRKNFSTMIESKWSPYALASRWRVVSTTRYPSFGPAWDGAINGIGTGFSSTDNQLSDLHSVEVIITRDRTKWSRCLVMEMGEDKALNFGGADKFEIRRSPSVDKNGAPDGTGTGYGWFPGYAIDLETGERLNIMFGEDSSLPGENGGDMIWNPTSTLLSNTGRPVFGGRHNIYIMAAKRFALGSGSSAIVYNGPRYDECADYGVRLSTSPAPGMPASALVRKRQVLSQVIYTSMALTDDGTKMLSPWQNLVPSDVKITIHVKRPYANFSADGVVTNDSMPLFRFNTDGFATIYNDVNIAKKVLDKVSIVPNPYYAYSQYEDPGNQLDNRIKITNLPPKCLVQIYTQDGALVRTFRKDDNTQTYLDWNLKNNAGVPIASGVYYIHVKATDLGEERIIKWFGVMRPVDFDTF